MVVMPKTDIGIQISMDTWYWLLYPSPTLNPLQQKKKTFSTFNIFCEEHGNIINVHSGINGIITVVLKVVVMMHDPTYLCCQFYTDMIWYNPNQSPPNSALFSYHDNDECLQLGKRVVHFVPSFRFNK